jgi:hypothetical protein
MLRRLIRFARKIREGADASAQMGRVLPSLLRMELLNALASTPRFQDPLRLLSSGFRVHSQGDEDGMIAEIFRRIGTGSRRFIEFGVGNGLDCNTTFLLTQGWSGAWIEAATDLAGAARAKFRDYPVDIVSAFMTVDTADETIAQLAGEQELDLLSIDIDFNDYWVWQAITRVKPRLVVIEYNAAIPPPVSLTVAHDPSRGWDGSSYFGASLSALEALGRAKGYSLVGCSLTGVNAFFVRDDLVGDRFCAPFTAANHWEPPRYALAGQQGHPPGIGPWVAV